MIRLQLSYSTTQASRFQWDRRARWIEKPVRLNETTANPVS
jgi:hypothetical protein